MNPLQALASRFRREHVPLSILRHSDRPAYVSEGYGGRPLEDWPVVRFFRMYAQGQRILAFEAFAKWYVDQFERYCNVSKNAGGMNQGSLFRLTQELHVAHEQPFDPRHQQIDRQLLERAVQLRVTQRFQFLELIVRSGFRNELNTSPIIGVRRGGTVVLEGGHHRAGALITLGEKTLPELFVIPKFSRAVLTRVIHRGYEPAMTGHSPSL
jgi:hypothetical protein